MTGQEAMIGGLADMARYAATTIADTARSSDQVGMTVNRNCVAYVRVVQLAGVLPVHRPVGPDIQLQRRVPAASEL